MQGRAYYGLARIDPPKSIHEAKNLFERTADSGADPSDYRLGHVYLGRIALAEHNDKKAKGAVQNRAGDRGISAMAIEAAQKGLESTSSKGDKAK